MALTYQRASKIVNLFRATCNHLKISMDRRHDAINQTTAQEIDWKQAAEFLHDDAEGNLDGFQFSRADLALAIDALTAIAELIDSNPALLRIADAEA